MGKHAKNELMFPTDGQSYKSYWAGFDGPKHNKEIS